MTIGVSHRNARQPRLNYQSPTHSHDKWRGRRRQGCAILPLGAMRFRPGLNLAVLLLLLPTAVFAAGLSFQAVKKEVVEQRLQSFSRDNSRREAILRNMFAEVGCGQHLTEE